MTTATPDTIDPQTAETTDTVDAIDPEIARQIEVAAAFLRAIFPEGAYVSVRPVATWTEGSKKKTSVDYHGISTITIDAVLEMRLLRILKRAQARGDNVFFGCAQRFRHRLFEKSWQIRCVAFLWADDDSGDLEAAKKKFAEKGLPDPSVITMTGRGHHFYWLLTEVFHIDDVGDPAPVREKWFEINGKNKPIEYFENEFGDTVWLKDPATGDAIASAVPKLSPKAQFIQDINAGIAAELGSDNTHDLARMFRVVGPPSRKELKNGAAPKPTAIIENNGRRYSIEQFAKFRDKSPLKQQRERTASSPLSSPRKLTPKLSDDLSQRVAACEIAEDRSRADYALCCWAVENDINKEDLWQEVQSRGKFAERGRGYFDMTYDKAAVATPKPPGSGKAEHPPVAICENFSLQITSERQTASGKIVVQTKLVEGKQSRALVEVTSAISSQAAAKKTLAKYIPAETLPQVDLDAVVNNLILSASERLAQNGDVESGEVESVRDVVLREVPPKFDLKFRVSDGKLWSDVWGRAVSRQEFISFTPGWLIDATMAAHDAEENDIRQIRSVREALGVVWASLHEALPRNAAEVEGLGVETSAAARFRADIFRVWTAPVLFKSVSIGKGDEMGTARASLASLAADLYEGATKNETAKLTAREKWQQIRTSVPAWWRVSVTDEGEIHLRLAMRFDLFDNLRIPCEWATDQKSFKRIGRNFGFFADDATDTDVSLRLSDGKRLAVLSEEMQQEILSQPTNGDGKGNATDDEDSADDAVASAEENSEMEAA